MTTAVGSLIAARNLTAKGWRRLRGRAASAWKVASNLSLKQWRRAKGRARFEWKRVTEAVKDVRHVFGSLEEEGKNASIHAYRRTVKAVRRPVREFQGRRRDVLDQKEWNRTEWAVEREIGDIVAGDHPIIAGPWLAEVGYEVLYWVPFLEWVRDAFLVDSARVVAVSRGGVASWYGDAAARYAEIWDEMEPDEFARRNAARAEFKQSAASDLDREIAARVERRFELRGARVLHPSLMFRLFKLFWSGHRAMGFMDAHTRFRLMRPPQTGVRAALPDRYAAVKLYTARSLPDQPDVRRRVRRLLDDLSEQMPIVLLETGLAVDDHTDMTPESGARIINARDLMEPRNNLAVQTDIVAGAERYIGTCGSITWLAPRLGVPTAALFTDDEFLHNHMAVALRTSARLEGAGRFSPVDLRGLP